MPRLIIASMHYASFTISDSCDIIGASLMLIRLYAMKISAIDRFDADID